jgi:hypothetical protein
MLLFVVIFLVLGGDPSQLLSLLSGPQVGARHTPSSISDVKAQAEAPEFVSTILADTEDVWDELFRSQGRRYTAPKLVLYSDQINSACGFSTAASGPFYCPVDKKIYLDLSFLGELKRLGAKGDFAVAYVIAHEVAHHVQNMLGTIPKVSQLQRKSSKVNANRLQVMVELQADCLAGVWANQGNRDRNILEEGDIEEGLRAAAAIGDDRLQKMSGRGVHPESFTHGSSKQRAKWLLTGLKSGNIKTCNTFSDA